MKLRYKTLLIFFVVLLVPLLLVLAWSVNSLKNNQNTNLTTQAALASKLLSSEVNSFVSRRVESYNIQILDATATEVLVEQQEYLLREIIQKDSAVMTVAIVNATGLEQTRLSRNSSIIESTNRDVSQEPFFQKASQGQVYFGSVGGSSETPYLTMAAPIINGSHIVLGVLSLQLDLSGVQEVLNTHYFTQSAYAYLVNQSGQVVLTPTIVSDSNRENITMLSTEKLLHFVNNDFYREEYTGLTGERVRGLVSAVSPLNWYLVVEWPVANLGQIISTNLLQLTLVVLLAFLATFIMSLIYVSRISNRLERVIEGVHIISSGNLKYRIKVPSHDEAGLIADAVNKLADQLILK